MAKKDVVTLRPYQQDALNAMRVESRGICVAPAGSGKTIIAADILTLPHEVI